MRPRPPWCLLFALLAVVLLAGPALVAAGSETPQATRYYLLSSDDGSTYTLFARHHVGGAANETIRFALPLGSEPDTVTDEGGDSLQWAHADDGWILVGVRNDTVSFLVTARGLPGPATPEPVRFPDDLFPAYVVYLGLPDRYTVPDSDDAAATEITAVFPGVPVPDGRTYHFLRPDGVGATIDARPTDAASTTPYALLLALVVLLGATTLWLMVRVHRSADDPTRPAQMPILEHLEELRRRLLWILSVFVAAALFFFTFGIRSMTVAGMRLPVPVPSVYDNAAAQVFAWLTRHVVPGQVTVVVISPWDAVVTQVTIAFALGILVAFPVLFYHGYAFVAPALYPKERRAVFLTVPVVVVLFAIGAAFGLGIMLPFTINMLYGFAGTLAATAFLNVPDLVAIGMLMAIVFGLAFELPVVMALLSGIGLVQAATWRKYWRHALVTIAIVAALVTDPTIITQLIVAAVLSLLYAVGAVLAVVFEKKRIESVEAKPLAAGSD